ncbi:MAG: hypothetical protein IRZ23_00855 [Acetobacteraceae bacterium]|nr:hypothetical protein [Acetobacteraceae bacterium]
MSRATKNQWLTVDVIHSRPPEIPFVPRIPGRGFGLPPEACRSGNRGG